MTENIRVLTRNIRILGSLPPSLPCSCVELLLWRRCGIHIRFAAAALLSKLCIQEAGQGEADLDKIIWKDLRMAET